MDQQEPADKQHEPTEFQPGDTISPATHPVALANPVQSTEQPINLPSPVADATTQPQATQPNPSVQPPQPPTAPIRPSESVQSIVAQQLATAPKPQATQPALSHLIADEDGITWTASEFIDHSKSLSWYLSLGAVAVVLAAIVFLLTKDKITTAVVIVAAIAFGTIAARKPRELQYGLHSDGLMIGPKLFPYELFRSFAVVDDGTLVSIMFMPMKRFGQLLTIYFDPQDENEIVELLASRLPLEDRQHDMLDRFMKRIRF